MESAHQTRATLASMVQAAAADEDDKPNANLTNSMHVFLAWAPWKDRVKRATAKVVLQLTELQIDSWIVTWRHKVWRYAARLADVPQDRWTIEAANREAAECSKAKRRWQHGPRKRGWMGKTGLNLQQTRSGGKTGNNVCSTTW